VSTSARNTARLARAAADPVLAAEVVGEIGHKTIQRSINLTPFGDDFCRVCLPLDTAEMEALSAEAADSPSS
jgi:hypothetical protein